MNGCSNLPPFDPARLHERWERVFLVLAGLFLGTLAMLNIHERFMNHVFPLAVRGFMLWRWISNFTRRLRRVVGGFGVRRSSGRR